MRHLIGHLEVYVSGSEILLGLWICNNVFDLLLTLKSLLIQFRHLIMIFYSAVSVSYTIIHV